MQSCINVSRSFPARVCALFCCLSFIALPSCKLSSTDSSSIGQKPKYRNERLHLYIALQLFTVSQIYKKLASDKVESTAMIAFEKELQINAVRAKFLCQEPGISDYSRKNLKDSIETTGRVLLKYPTRLLWAEGDLADLGDTEPVLPMRYPVGRELVAMFGKQSFREH